MQRRDVMICYSLIDTEIQSRALGCRQRQNMQPHYDCRCCRFGISGMAKHYILKFQSFDVITSLVSLDYWGYGWEKMTSQRNRKSHSKCLV
jgi:hypothetical protein